MYWIRYTKISISQSIRNISLMSQKSCHFLPGCGNNLYPLPLLVFYENSSNHQEKTITYSQLTANLTHNDNNRSISNTLELKSPDSPILSQSSLSVWTYYPLVNLITSIPSCIRVVFKRTSSSNIYLHFQAKTAHIHQIFCHSIF